MHHKENDTLCNKVLRAISNYAEPRVILTSHKELSDDKIKEFQPLFDDEFFKIWVDIFGLQGISKKIHLLGSGHIHYFLKEYEC
jgi:hypothetical protein